MDYLNACVKNWRWWLTLPYFAIIIIPLALIELLLLILAEWFDCFDVLCKVYNRVAKNLTQVEHVVDWVWKVNNE